MNQTSNGAARLATDSGELANASRMVFDSLLQEVLDVLHNLDLSYSRIITGGEACTHSLSMM